MRSVKKTVRWTVFSDARVGRVGRQEDQVIALGAQQVDDLARFVGRQVVGHHDLSRTQRRGEFAHDIGLETVAVHRTVQNPGGDQSVMGEARDEGLGVPVAEGRMVNQALSHRSPAGGLDEVGLEARLVDEDQPFQHVGPVRLAGFDPDPAPLGHLGSQDFAGEQCFFYG